LYAVTTFAAEAAADKGILCLGWAGLSKV